MKARRILLLCSLLSLASIALGAPDVPDYRGGRQAWLDGDYQTASQLLLRYRQIYGFGQSPEVDYWLATSWCRLPGQENQGLELLDWALANYSLPERKRDRFLSERIYCDQMLRQDQRMPVPTPPPHSRGQGAPPPQPLP